jgi:hypothetical protein
VLVGLPEGVCGLVILFYFILVYSYNTHQVLVRAAPRGWWSCYFILSHFILVYFHHTHQVHVGLPQGDGGLVLLFVYLYLCLFCFVHFSLFLWHASGARRAAPRGWWPCSFICVFVFILVCFSLVLWHAPGACRAAPKGLVALFFYFYVCFWFILVYFYNTHRVHVGAARRGWWPCYFISFYCNLFYFILL